ncbi:hypothetical protein A0257_14490 [Hymenobacter psoromatis]|nr:hypothetical protein A0257_14490 [Hymenobacter psoromatis]
MKRPLFLLLAAGLACGAAACTPNSGTADSPAGSDAAAADTAGAHASMRMDRSGVRMDSASTKPIN